MIQKEEEIDLETYTVRKMNRPLNAEVTVPGSKSITNRALLMAALAKGQTLLKGVLFSDDSRHFLSSLIALGFPVEIEEEKAQVKITGMGGKIPVRTGTIDVGSAGTAARFLTAMLSLSDGSYTINASEQMKLRPMKPLFEALEKMGASFVYLEKEGFLPVVVHGTIGVPEEVSIDISKSTQFLSALMMVAPMLTKGLMIHITSKKKDGSYIRITRRMMEEFGCTVAFDGEAYLIAAEAQYELPKRLEHAVYQIEPDVSAACYFYAAAAVTGGCVCVRNVHFNGMQGDLKFLSVLEQMGCSVQDTEAGIVVKGPEHGKLTGVDVDMNDFSDQTMTLAAIAPFASGEVRIRNISHIRLQESDRVQAIVTNLSAMGIVCREEGDGLVIQPGVPKPAKIETFDDHRMAMAFAITGLRADGITILDQMCCRKTFEHYFDVLEELTRA